MKRIAATFSLLLLGMVVVGTSVWGALALYYSYFAGECTRIAIAFAFGLCDWPHSLLGGRAAAKKRGQDY